MPSYGSTDTPGPSVHTVKLPRHRLRSLAATLHSLQRPVLGPTPTPADAITVVCVSDTHNTQPSLPPGDLLLHAGDLSNWGSFAEIQCQLTWLSRQPHRYKVVVAGNHDLLLDGEFKEQHPQRWEHAMKQSVVEKDENGGASSDELFDKTAKDLDWGDVIYLHNSRISLIFPSGSNDRHITIYGSPITPQHGTSAFQHAPSTDAWTRRVPRDTDIILTHGPPWGHLDGLKKSGCAFLAREVARVRPRLVVYGHIHVAYGLEERVYDGVGRAHEGILGQWGGWMSLIRMAWHVLYGYLVPRHWARTQHKTTFVNASVVQGWEQHVVKNEAVVVQI